MEQLLAHLWGDYILQSQWMADNKGKSHWAAFVHAWLYTSGFWLLTQSWAAIFVIFATHFLIDRYRLARFVVYAKNLLPPDEENPRRPWSDCNATGYPNTMPSFLSVWLLIAADNTLHLTINYLAIRYL
jgi:hypothetical protein